MGDGKRRTSKGSRRYTEKENTKTWYNLRHIWGLGEEEGRGKVMGKGVSGIDKGVKGGLAEWSRR